MARLLQSSHTKVAKFLVLFLLNFLSPSIVDAAYKIQRGQIKSIENALDLEFDSDGKPALLGHLGWGLPSAVGQPSTQTCDPDEADECFEYGDYARVYLTQPNEANGYCARVDWHSTYARRLEDCYDLQTNVHWYGGFGQKFVEAWPIESISRVESAVVSGGFWEGTDSGAVSENYWLASSNAVIHVDHDVPLFFSLNATDRPNKLCFVGQNKYPYKPRQDLRLKYEICTGGPGENLVEVHKRALKKFYELPTEIPDEGALIKPFWSTWAEYKTEINQTLVMELGRRIIAEGFENSSHVEIDDNWETCYGEMKFDPAKFPDPAAMTAQLLEMGLRTTLWTHPFINLECPSYTEALELGYFVKDENGRPGNTAWWQSTYAGSGIIDFTNPDAVAWWSSRLERLRTLYGIDSFKFDAGEVKDMPHSYQLTGDTAVMPNLITTKYVQVCASFGNMIEVRVGKENQKEPIFMRMVDKGSQWGYDGGLRSLIPALLDFGIKGYSYVLPDMIGGNAYGNFPSRELYIRWMQANAFMPSVQFSLLPWNYDQEAVDIVKSIVELREEYSGRILKAAYQTVQDGSPINRPMWWVDPLDLNTYTIDDQYMLGDDLLVAPVLTEGAVTRDIYLPQGQWTGQHEGEWVTYEGPRILFSFPAPLDQLPYFLKVT